MKLVLQLFHQSSLFLLRIQFFCLFQSIEFVLLSVHYRKVEQGFFVASLRDGKGYIFEIEINFLRHYDFLCIAFESLSEFDNSKLKQFFVCLVQLLLIFNREALVDTAIRNVDVVDECHFFIRSNREYIDIIYGVADNFALADEFVDSQIFPFYFFCFFEPELL